MLNLFRDRLFLMLSTTACRSQRPAWQPRPSLGRSGKWVGAGWRRLANLGTTCATGGYSTLSTDVCTHKIHTFTCMPNCRPNTHHPPCLAAADDFLDDREAAQFVQEHATSNESMAYDSLLVGAQRTDLLRMLLLEYRGGVYADLDAKLLAPLPAPSSHRSLRP